MTYSA